MSLSMDSRRLCIAVLGSMAALSVAAQPAPQTIAPAAAARRVPAPAYRSSFETYRPFADEKVLPWRQTNDTVGERGGWRAYAREAQEGAAPGEGDDARRGTPPATPPQPTPGTSGRKDAP